MCQTYYFHTLSFYFFNKFHFPHNVFCFVIPYLHSYSIIFKNILSSSPFLFFPSSSSFSFPLFSSFQFCPFFSYFFSSQFASFPQFDLPFPKSAAPVLPHFLLPWSRAECLYTFSSLCQRLGLTRSVRNKPRARSASFERRRRESPPEAKDERSESFAGGARGFAKQNRVFEHTHLPLCRPGVSIQRNHYQKMN